LFHNYRWTISKTSEQSPSSASEELFVQADGLHHQLKEFYENQACKNKNVTHQFFDNMVGFDAKNKNALPQSFLCAKCVLIFRDPCQLNCGHRLCRTCVDGIDGDVVKCIECSEETSKTEILPDRGFRNDMKILPIECTLCTWAGTFKDYEEHLKSLHPNPACPFCQTQFDSIDRLEMHKKLECTQITIPCALKEYGCVDSVLRVEMAQHYLTINHQNAIVQFVRRLTNRSTTEYADRAFSMDIDSAPIFPTSTSANTTTTTTTTIDSASNQMQEVYDMINVLAGGIQALNDDTQRLSTESIRIQTAVDSVSQELTSLKLSVQEQGTFLDGIKPNQEILHQDVASLKQKMDDLQNVSYDGTLIWKITSFREKMMDAQSERQTSIYSPPFFSSPTGYKMRARLYLHGDGNARRTHMSLFFVLMRGPNDAILKFPFSYKVTFCLYDQTPQQRHIVDSFRPDIKSNSFQRPRSEMNIASGIPKFFPLAMIQQDNNPYVQDDTMFIKIMVDFGDMPKTMLPYVLSLNPALPAHVQQMMIKQEQERRNQQAATAAARASGPETMQTSSSSPIIPTSPNSENPRLPGFDHEQKPNSG